MELRDLLLELHMDDLVRMLDASGTISDRALILGDAQADVLSLLPALGVEGALGERPLDCRVRCDYAGTFSAEIEGEDGSVTACQDRDELRIFLRRQAPACVHLHCPSPLLRGRELVFLTLREESVERDMAAYGVDCLGTVAVVSAAGAPATALFTALKWLREKRGLTVDALPVVLNHCEAVAQVNVSVLLPISMALGAQTLPQRFSCDFTSADATPAAALGEALACCARGAGQAQNLNELRAQAARAADGRLEDELRALGDGEIELPELPGVMLAEKFGAIAHMYRYRIADAIPDGVCELYDKEFQGFAAFLQENLAATFEEARRPLGKDFKSALLAYSVSYLSDAFSHFSAELSQRILEREIAPSVERVYADVMRRISEETERVAMDIEVDRDRIHQLLADTYTPVSLSGLGSLISMMLSSALSELGYPLKTIIGKSVGKVIERAAEIAIEHVMPDRSRLKRMAGQLQELCDRAAQQFCEEFRNTTLPEMRGMLLEWFDARVEEEKEAFSQLDAGLLERHRSAVAALDERRRRIAAIEAKRDALRPYWN